MLKLINKGQIKKLKTVAKGGVFLAAVLCFSVCLFSPLLVQGQEDPPVETVAQPQLDLGLAYAEQTGLPTTDLRLIIANIIRVALGLLGIIAVVIILYGGWLWMSAGGNEDQIGKAKKTLINGVIGLVIILSAYSIVIFVMRMLGIGGGVPGEGQYAYQQPGIMNIAGSGAWGKVIKDHYPTPNQTEVPRNTKIAITFAKPIKFDSVATEVTDELGRIVRYDLKNNVISISAILSSSTAPGGYEVKPYGEGSKIYAFPVTNTVSGVEKSELYTIVLEPTTLLGDGDKNIKYAVRIEGVGTNAVQAEDGSSVFKNSRSNFYQWFFICSTKIDETPPTVVSVSPRNEQTETKDVTIQITFSEPIFPNAQVSFASTTGIDYYFDATNKDIVFLKSDHSSVPLGTFKIVNQYRTLEFASSLTCGVNACGLPKYCLPVCDKVSCASDNYQIVFKTPPTTTDSNDSEFAADMSSPSSGIMDMAGNALDANKDEIYDRNTISPFVTGFSNPDNYGWNFTLTTKMDTTSPYITNLSIGPQTEMVGAYDDLNISWSKLMKYSTLYNIEINEYPDPALRCTILGIPSNRCSLETLGKAPSSSEIADKTFTQILHTRFLDGFNQYYLPEVTSAVEDNHGNCYYPGAGPVEHGRDVSSADKNSCANSTDSYCCNGVGAPNPFGGTYSATCTKSLGVDDY